MSDDVLLNVQSGVAEVILNRPERKNAITGPLGVALADRLTEASNRDDINVIVLCGAEGAFCSGLDLGEFNRDPAPTWLAGFSNIWRGAHKALFECKKPIIGALESYAINGGAALALACDLLIAGKSAFLQVGEVQIGMAAPYNMAWLSLRHSEQTMAEVALLGDRISGTELKKMELALQAVDDSEVLAVARSLAARLSEYPEGGLMRIKAGLRARLEDDADAWFDRFIQRDPVGKSPKPSSMKGR